MDLLHNPFHILGVSPLDTKERILEAADEKKLLVEDEELISSSCAELINPKRRLLSEIAWLSAESKDQIPALLEALQSKPEKVISRSETLLPFDRFNVLVSALSSKPPLCLEDLASWIIRIASDYNLILVEELADEINDIRNTSGFPAVDHRMIEDALIERRRWCRSVIIDVLDLQSPMDIVHVVTKTVDHATKNGTHQAPEIIDDLVEAYEVEAQPFFIKETENIKRLAQLLKETADAKKPDEILAFLTDKLVEVVKNWDLVAQPIQVSAQSRGILHQPSKDVADLVRSTAVCLFNEHGTTTIALELTSMLKAVFAEVLEVVETLKEDEETLKQHEEWEKDLTFEAVVEGTFLKTIRTSKKGIEWNGRHWPLEQIIGIRWGGMTTTTTYRGYFSTNTTTETLYKISWRSDKERAYFETQDPFTYRKLTDILWKTVGVRLLLEMLKGLEEGRTFYFDTLTLNDYGVTLTKQGFLSGPERVDCPWKELSTWSQNGVFNMAKKNDARFTAQLPYLKIDNVHILEAAINALFEKGRDIERLSSAL